MRRPTSPQKVSKPEEEAIIAEGRKTTAEGEVVSLSQAKKNIESGIETLDHVKKGLIKGNEDILVATNSYKEKLEGAKKEFIEYVKEIEKKKVSFVSSIIETRGELIDLNNNRSIIRDSITKLEDTEYGLKVKITNLDININNRKAQQEEIENKIKQLPSVEKLEAEILAKKSEIEILINKENALKDSIVPIEELISKKKDQLASIETVITLSENELDSLGKKKEEVIEYIKNENKKLEERQKSTNENASVVALSERRIEEKTQLLLRLIEKAKSENLIKDFQII